MKTARLAEQGVSSQQHRTVSRKNKCFYSHESTLGHEKQLQVCSLKIMPVLCMSCFEEDKRDEHEPHLPTYYVLGCAVRKTCDFEYH